MSALWSLSGGYDLAKFPMTRAKNSDGPGSDKATLVQCLDAALAGHGGRR
jgi:hypothetical protein